MFNRPDTPRMPSSASWCCCQPALCRRPVCADQSGSL